MKNPAPIRKLAAILLTSLVAFHAKADDTYVAPVEDALELAQQQYAKGRYREAFGNFYWAAIRDDARAQEIVGLMYLVGRKVYGPSVRTDKSEADFWLGEAKRRGRNVERSVDCATRGAREGRRAAPGILACLTGQSG